MNLGHNASALRGVGGVVERCFYNPPVDFAREDTLPCDLSEDLSTLRYGRFT